LGVHGSRSRKKDDEAGENAESAGAQPRIAWNELLS
jgi:hypothetical protein